ncbi:MAG: eukaryotic-like serine/threonine-protein kinase [Actinomycetota bacterium]|jgi:peptide/nickel transport system substrate-binding protein|nr:eukaryotic-like serine/threonine-protein kinase [Actinomycetota bacterium]
MATNPPPAVPLEPLAEDDPVQVGEYRLLGRLGSGGMGVAYLATGSTVNWVVVKTAWRHLAADRSFRARLVRELDAMRRSAGPHTAALLDADLDAPVPWFAMEFIPGVTLSHRIEDRGPLPEAEVASLATGLAEVLAGVHASGVVHRDIKPGNIMLSPTGPRLIDFGIADVDEGTQLTKTGMVLGSTGWLAAEQVTGDAVTPATDIHAWALSVLFASTGVPPFGADNTTAAIYKVLESMPDVPDTVPEPLHGLLVAALAKDPARRPTLERIQSTLGMPPATPPVTLASPPPPHPPSAAPPPAMIVDAPQTSPSPDATRISTHRQQAAAVDARRISPPRTPAPPTALPTPSAPQPWIFRHKTSSLLILILVLALALAGGAIGLVLSNRPDTNPTGARGGEGASGITSAEGQLGGTINVLAIGDQFLHVDPQRVYNGVDIAFLNGYTTRTLTAYKMAPGPDGVTIVPDMATDTGTSSNGATTWAFTLRDGVSFQDGSPVTCADIKYGVSRTFATDVITDGPTFAISLLDIPKAADGSSNYKGPYSADASNDVASFDKAITCSADGKTITFNLSRPAGDFNYTVTLPAFSPVQKAKDTGAKYDDAVQATGPYQIKEYTKGQRMVLERNPNWSKASDDYRPAYPDQVVVTFALDPAAIDERLIADAGEDQAAVTFAGVQPENLATVFGSDDPRFKGRSVDGYDPYVRYLAINATKVSNQKQRQAIAVALNRAELITIAGGDFAGDLGDGVMKPNLATDYAPSGMWTDMFGAAVPDAGDPVLAKKLIAESGEAMPELTYQYPRSPTNDTAAASIKGSLEKAGMVVKLSPIAPERYYDVVLYPDQQEAIVSAGWGPDWQNASTIIPELFGANGGFNLSRVNDPAYEAEVQAAIAMTNRTAQAEAWKSLNKKAMEQAWVVPTRFSKVQYLWGSKVGNGYLWDAYSSFAFGDLFVKG